MPATPAWFVDLLRRSDFLARYPHYAAVLARLTPMASRDVETMAVTARRGEQRVFLLVNVPYFAANPEQFAGILMHEVHHVVLGHLTDPAIVEAEHADLMQLATEASANEFITEPLPDPITWDTFAEVGMRPQQHTLERYALLVRARQGGKLPPLPRSRCCTDAAAPAPGDDGCASSIDLLAPWLAPWLAPHSRWARRRRPRAPSLRDLPTQPVEGRPLAWTSLLAQLLRRRRALDWRRPNRRFPERVGEVAGHARRQPDTRLLVAIDTSGSMTAAELRRIAQEVRRLARHGSLTIVECDDRVRRTYPFRGSLNDVAGGGSTDLRPVFEPTLLRARRAGAVIYFTDGGGPCPERRPPIPTLWVLTADTPFPCPFGLRVRLRV